VIRPELAEKIALAARRIGREGRAAALTGAGISVESGIPDFRSKGGLWSRYAPEEYATIHAFRSDPRKVWRMLADMEALLDAAQPNPAHLALAELEETGHLGGVITQNIDGLHQRAGSRNVIEFHGSHLTLSCLDCGKSYTREEARRRAAPPPCDCGTLLKPDVILFDETIPMAALERSRRLASETRTMLVVGTSAEVVPASHMPRIAKANGATVVEINLVPTHLTRDVTDIFLQGNAGEILPRLAEEVRSRRRP